MEWKTHVAAVEHVGELDSVAGRGGLVDLVLGDELGAVVVLLLTKEGERGGQNGGVRVGDPRQGSQLQACMSDG